MTRAVFDRMGTRRTSNALFVGTLAMSVMSLSTMTALSGCGGGGGTSVPGSSGGKQGAGSGGKSDTGIGGNGTAGQPGTGGAVIASGGSVGSAGGSGEASGGAPGSGGTAGAAGSTVSTSGSGGISGGGSTGTPGAAGTSGGGGKGGGNAGRGGTGIAGRAGATGGRSGGGPGGGGGAVASASTATLLVDLGNAFCAAARTCCAMKNMSTATLGDCEAKFPERLWRLPGYNQGTATVDNARLSACIAGYKETATTCAFQPLEAACKDVFTGTKAAGAACGKGGVPSAGGSGECQPVGRATLCLWTGDSNLPTTTGVCVNPAHAKKGDPCATSCAMNDDCTFDLYTAPGYSTALCFEEDGLYCAPKADGDTESRCASIVATGGSCEDDSQSCASGDSCDRTTTPAKCRKDPTLGQACASSGSQCASGMSLVCGTSNKCEDLGFAYFATCEDGRPPFPL